MILRDIPRATRPGEFFLLLQCRSPLQVKYFSEWLPGFYGVDARRLPGYPYVVNSARTANILRRSPSLVSGHWQRGVEVDSCRPVCVVLNTDKRMQSFVGSYVSPPAVK